MIANYNPEAHHENQRLSYLSEGSILHFSDWTEMDVLTHRAALCVD